MSGILGVIEFVRIRNTVPNKNRLRKMQRKKYFLLDTFFLQPELENFCVLSWQKMFLDGWPINFQRLKTNEFFL